jgi:hypothetical protein
MYAKWAIVAFAIHVGLANVKANENDPLADTTIEIDIDQAITQVTSVASPTASLSATLPSQVPPPPPQAWCPSKIFCPGAVRHVIAPCVLVSDMHIDYRSCCKPSTLLTCGRTRKFSLINPRPRIRSPSWLLLHPSTLPALPRARCFSSSTITFAAKDLSSRQKLSQILMLTPLS